MQRRPRLPGTKTPAPTMRGDEQRAAMPDATRLSDLDAGRPRTDPSRSAAPFGRRRRRPARARTRSASRTSATSSDVPGAGVEHLGHDRRRSRSTRSGPSRKASTATSLAPLSTAGAPPPARPAAYASAQAREGVEVGGLERELRRASSSRSRRTASASRSGAPSASPIGRRMSGIESCAIVAPSTNSTMLCTIDCGCTTTSIRSKPTPNSSCASITSRPLFISVERVDRDLGAHVPGGVRAARRRR